MMIPIASRLYIVCLGNVIMIYFYYTNISCGVDPGAHYISYTTYSSFFISYHFDWASYPL